MDKDVIGRIKFRLLAKEFSNDDISRNEADILFNKISFRQKFIRMEDFIKFFKQPKPENDWFMQKCKKLREWLKRNKMITEILFGRLLDSSGTNNKFLAKSEFLKAIRIEKLLDLDNIMGSLLFDYLDKDHDNKLTFNEWQK